LTLRPRDHAATSPTLGTLFAQALAGADDRVALAGGDVTISYRQLRDRVGRLLSVFDHLGLQPGDGVGLALSGMTVDFAALYIACHVAGLWTTELPPHLPVDVALERAQATRVRLVIVDAGTDAERLNILTSALPGRLASVVGRETPSDVVDLADLLGGADPSPVVPRPAGPYCAIVFTSGSTGKPKPVLIPSYGAGLHAIMVMATLRYPVLPVAVVPVTHLLILQFLFVPILLLGGTVVTVAPYSTDGILSAAMHHGANVLFLTTTEIYELADRPDTSGLSGQLKLIFYGGEPMSAARLSTVTEAFGQVFVGAYGQTETLTAAFLHPADHDPTQPELLAAAGRAIVGARIEVRGEAGPMPTGQPGEIAICSPGCMVGYLGMDSDTRKTIQHGWVSTGDIGYLDERGYVHVLDRAKFAFKSGQSMVYPNVVEQALTRHRDVARAAVVGTPDSGLGHRICAAVVLRAGSSTRPEDLMSLFADGTVPAPHEFRIVDALPVTAAHKIDRTRVRELFG
jgi:fatty-acyl-CoA synthase